MKKAIKYVFTLILLQILIFNVACFSTNIIKNGKYYCIDPTNQVFELGEDGGDCYFQIVDNEAISRVSGYIDYKAKIVEIDGEIYFEGYTFKEAMSNKELGSTDKFHVIYNKKQKSFQIISIT